MCFERTDDGDFRLDAGCGCASVAADAPPTATVQTQRRVIMTRRCKGIASMLKLLLCLAFSALLAVTTLQLRQQRLELNYQANRLHGQIRQSQAKLWHQQLQIAIYTAPNAIAKTVGDHELNMVPVTPLPARMTNWIDVHNDPDAE
jgi:cell division protein FtsL